MEPKEHLYLIPSANSNFSRVCLQCLQDMGYSAESSTSLDGTTLIKTNFPMDKRGELDKELFKKIEVPLSVAFLLSHTKIKGRRVYSSGLPPVTCNVLKGSEVFISKKHGAKKGRTLINEPIDFKLDQHFLLTPSEYCSREIDPCLLCSVRRSEKRFRSTILTIGYANENVPADRNVRRDAPFRKMCEWCYISAFFNLAYGGNFIWIRYAEPVNFSVPYTVADVTFYENSIFVKTGAPQRQKAHIVVSLFFIMTGKMPVNANFEVNPAVIALYYPEVYDMWRRDLSEGIVYRLFSMIARDKWTLQEEKWRTYSRISKVVENGNFSQAFYMLAKHKRVTKPIRRVAYAMNLLLSDDMIKTISNSSCVNVEKVVYLSERWKLFEAIKSDERIEAFIKASIELTGRKRERAYNEARKVLEYLIGENYAQYLYTGINRGFYKATLENFLEAIQVLSNKFSKFDRKVIFTEIFYYVLAELLRFRRE